MTLVIPRWALWAFFPATAVLVLGLYSTQISAQGVQQQPGQPPFANSVEQRGEMIKELREIKELLKEQNALFRASLKTEPHGAKSRP